MKEREREREREREGWGKGKEWCVEKHTHNKRGCVCEAIERRKGRDSEIKRGRERETER